MEQAQLIMTWWQHNITTQRHNMEQAQLIMTWWQHNITTQRHNMEEVQLIMTWRQHNITIQRHNMEKAQHESMALSLRQLWRSIQIYNKIAFSLYPSLPSIWYFELGRSYKVRQRIRVFLFKRTILLLIHHQFLQFWYQCIKKTSIYHIIGNFPPNCRRNTRKTDEVYDFLQSARMTFELRKSCSAIHQMRCRTEVACDDWLIERSVLVQRSNATIWGEIDDNVINGSLLDTLVPKLKKLMMN